MQNLISLTLNVNKHRKLASLLDLKWGWENFTEAKFHSLCSVSYLGMGHNLVSRRIWCNLKSSRSVTRIRSRNPRLRPRSTECKSVLFFSKNLVFHFDFFLCLPCFPRLSPLPGFLFVASFRQISFLWTLDYLFTIYSSARYSIFRWAATRGNRRLSAIFVLFIFEQLLIEIYFFFSPINLFLNFNQFFIFFLSSIFFCIYSKLSSNFYFYFLPNVLSLLRLLFKPNMIQILKSRWFMLPNYKVRGGKTLLMFKFRITIIQSCEKRGQ